MMGGALMHFRKFCGHDIW